MWSREERQRYSRISSVDEMVDTAARHLGNGTAHHVMFQFEAPGAALRLCGGLAHSLGARAGISQRVHHIDGLDWRSHDTLIASLATAVEKVMGHKAHQYHSEEARLRQLLRGGPVGEPAQRIAFVLHVPQSALRGHMQDCFLHLAAQFRGSDHSWVVLAPEETLRFGLDVVDATPFCFSFRAYKLDF